MMSTPNTNLNFTKENSEKRKYFLLVYSACYTITNEFEF